jgi:hypothetical protein
MSFVRKISENNNKFSCLNTFLKKYAVLDENTATRMLEQNPQFKDFGSEIFNLRGQVDYLKNDLKYILSFIKGKTPEMISIPRKKEKIWGVFFDDNEQEKMEEAAYQLEERDFEYGELIGKIQSTSPQPGGNLDEEIGNIIGFDRGSLSVLYDLLGMCAREGLAFMKRDNADPDIADVESLIIMLNTVIQGQDSPMGWQEPTQRETPSASSQQGIVDQLLYSDNDIRTQILSKFGISLEEFLSTISMQLGGVGVDISSGEDKISKKIKEFILAIKNSSLQESVKRPVSNLINWKKIAFNESMGDWDASSEEIGEKPGVGNSSDKIEITPIFKKIIDKIKVLMGEESGGGKPYLNPMIILNI